MSTPQAWRVVIDDLPAHGKTHGTRITSDAIAERTAAEELAAQAWTDHMQTEGHNVGPVWQYPGGSWHYCACGWVATVARKG